MSEETKTKKLFSWEGWKKEIPWIIGFAVLLLLAWGYHQETSACKAMVKSDCFQDCQFQEGVKELQRLYPDLMIRCNETTRTCEFNGVKDLPRNIIPKIKGYDDKEFENT